MSGLGAAFCEGGSTLPPRKTFFVTFDVLDEKSEQLLSFVQNKKRSKGKKRRYDYYSDSEANNLRTEREESKDTTSHVRKRRRSASPTPRGKDPNSVQRVKRRRRVRCNNVVEFPDPAVTAARQSFGDPESGDQVFMDVENLDGGGSTSGHPSSMLFDKPKFHRYEDQAGNLKYSRRFRNSWHLDREEPMDMDMDMAI